MKTSAQAWKAIEVMFSSQTRARSVNTHIALATTQKSNMMIAGYVGKMEALGDKMASTGKPLDDEEMVSYILTRLDVDYNPIVSAIVARVEPIIMS